jgi:anti-sigma factor RsiW
MRELSNYLDGEVDASFKRELESHLEECSDCKLVIDQTKLTIDLFCDSQLVELPAKVKSRLHDALRRKFAEKNA